MIAIFVALQVVGSNSAPVTSCLSASWLPAAPIVVVNPGLPSSQCLHEGPLGSAQRTSSSDRMFLPAAVGHRKAPQLLADSSMRIALVPSAPRNRRWGIGDSLRSVDGMNGRLEALQVESDTAERSWRRGGRSRIRHVRYSARSPNR